MRRSVIVLALAIAPGLLAAAEIEVGAEYPLRGEPVSVIVTEDGTRIPDARIVVTYRPNSETRYREELRVDATGEVEWTPREAGIVQLQAMLSEKESASAAAEELVAVRFAGFPPSGLAVMLVAGTLLFGGAVFSFWMLLTEPSVPEEPPST